LFTKADYTQTHRQPNT